VIESTLGGRWGEFARPMSGGTEIDWAGLQIQLEREAQRVLKRELQSNPLLVFMMQNPEQAMVQVAKVPVAAGGGRGREQGREGRDNRERPASRSATAVAAPVIVSAPVTVAAAAPEETAPPVGRRRARSSARS
jgi:hypothetical protein